MKTQEIFTEEFIKYAHCDKKHIVLNTCIKEYYVDSGVGLKKYHDSIINLGGDQAGYILKMALIIYGEKIKNITYRIV